MMTSCFSSILVTSLLAAWAHAFVPSSFHGRTTTTSGLAASTLAAPQATAKNPLADFDVYNNDRIPWIESGYNTWRWKNHDINYIEMGDPNKPALVLIHGFGASAYHWRYNLPKLAQDYHVFAYCQLGFGLSDKPVQDYSAELWRDQAVDFVRQVVQKPVTLAGNSLGGFTALYAGASDDIHVDGVVLLNGAGRFEDPDAQPEDERRRGDPFLKALGNWIQRVIIGASFIYTKQPARIQQILQQVYPNNPEMVDDELVQSIQYPAQNPNAAEVFYRVIKKNGNGPQQITINEILRNLECPLLLCWGQNDPWIRPKAADKIQALYSNAVRVNVDAGHCPHDEAPEAVNDAILKFMKQTTTSRAAALSLSASRVLRGGQ